MAGKSKKKKQTLTAWRPDFRNPELLPDTKVIRTGFLLNFIAISAALGLIFLVAFREYNSYSLSGALVSLEEQIQDNRGENRMLLQLNGRFRRAQKVLEEVSAFDRQPVMLSEFLNLVAELRDESMVLTNLTFRPAIITQGRRQKVDYRLSLSGSLSDKASPSPTTVITDFQDRLSESQLIEPYFKDRALSRFARDNKLNIFNFTVEISLNPEAKKE